MRSTLRTAQSSYYSQTSIVQEAFLRVIFYVFEQWCITRVIPHRQLREEVDEVLRGEHHRGIQRNHKASPQCQVQICCQLLYTHTD